MKKVLSSVIVALFLVTYCSQASQFQIIEGNFTWHEAKADAKAKGGRLAVLDSAGKQLQVEELMNVYPARSSFHIGLSYNGSNWIWVTGSQLSYDNWGPDEPNGVEAGHHYARLTTGGWGPLQFGDWNDDQAAASVLEKGYILEIIDPGPPELPLLLTFTEPKLGETLTLDATATSGYPAPTYQWYYEGFPISSVAGGTLPVLSIPVTLNPSIEGTYRCVATNSEGTAEVQTQVVLFRDDDNDGLSNYQEENIHSTNPQDSDSDDDGLSDGAEINNHETNPNSSDSDNDGFPDKQEIDELNTDPTTFNSAWGPFIVYEQDWVNTKDWLGWLKLQTDGWAWSSNENDYIWIPESSRDNSKGWIYVP